MSKDTLNWYDRNNPQREAVAKFRNSETEQKQDVMNEFMYFLKYDLEDELPESDLSDIQSLINKFIGLDMEKVKQDEREMLIRWINGQDVQPQEIRNLQINVAKKGK